MTRDPALAADVHRPPRGRARLAISIAFWTVYSLVLFVKPLSWWPEQLRGATLDLRRWLIGLIDLVYGSLGIHQTGSYPMPWANELRWGLYFFLTAGVIPWAILAIVRRGRPHDIGFRPPNRIGWRIVAVGFLVALPLQVWMVKSPTLRVITFHSLSTPARSPLCSTTASSYSLSTSSFTGGCWRHAGRAGAGPHQRRCGPTPTALSGGPCNG